MTRVYLFAHLAHVLQKQTLKQRSRDWFSAYRIVQVLSLDNAEPFWIKLIRRAVPVAFVKVLLQPGRLRKALAVNGFNFSRQNRPFSAGVLAKFPSREGAVLVQAHITRLDGLMLLR